MKKTIMFLTCAVMLSILAIPAHAESVDYKANGKLVTYDYDPWATAEVVNGRWSIIVKGDEVEFKAFYRERNLDEEEQSPVGSIDHFWISLVELETITIDYDTGECEITGDFYVKKKWWILPDNPDHPYPPQVVWLDPQWTGYGTVTIDETGIVNWFWGELQGPTLAIQY
jgi:hypothetical protein